MLFWCANGLELVVETFDFDASWCNLYNSILDEYELGGLYVSMWIQGLGHDFVKL